MKLQGPVLGYGCALVIAARTSVKMLVAEDYAGIPAIKEIWDSNESITLGRLATYYSFLLTERFAERFGEPYVSVNEDGEGRMDDRARAFLEAIDAVRRDAFPVRDSVVDRAIDRLGENDRKGIGDGSNGALLQYTEELTDIVRELLGLPPFAHLVDSMKFGIRTSAAFDVGIRTLNSLVEHFADDPEGALDSWSPA
jgi:hypothetical protein